MDYFHAWWKHREDQLNTIGDEGRQLELTLRTALMKADAWLLSQSELRRLFELCSSVVPERRQTLDRFERLARPYSGVRNRGRTTLRGGDIRVGRCRMAEP